LVFVDNDTYFNYYKSKRQEKYLEEKDLSHGVVSYDAIDSDEMCGEEMIPDTSENVEDVIATKLMIEKLYECLEMLNVDELWLIINLFYKGKTERQLAANLRCTQPIIHKRKVRILKKLKKLIENKN